MSSTMQQRMQEHLDGSLTDEMAQELLAYLSESPEAASEYDRLRRLDSMLSRVPHERAPERLALSIMARLAHNIEAQTELQTMPERTRQALVVSLSLVIVVMMPTMVAASWLVLYAQANPRLISEVIIRTIALMSLMIEAMVVLLEEIEALIHRDPQMCTLAITLIPMMLKAMMEYMGQELEGHLAPQIA